MKRIELGLDVGSTTVKGVVVSPENKILWKSYRRHNSHQPETVRDILSEVMREFPGALMELSITGSGGRGLAKHIGAQFIQEVNAVTLAVETAHPETGSVVELGGQDAKVMIWKGEEGKKSTLTFMNDKCAGGTGSTIDKIMTKIGITNEEVAEITDVTGVQIHQIAAKCGVFAETDVVGLLKAGISRKEIFISLCIAIVKQNLEVLVKGNVLNDNVLLLGGPNTFIPAFIPIWREYIQGTWELHGYTPKESDITKSITVPSDAHYYAAMGAVLFARNDAKNAQREPILPDLDKLNAYIGGGRAAFLESSTTVLPPLSKSQEELDAFVKEYEIPSFTPKSYDAGTKLNGYIGIDGGSTSTKMVILDEQGELIYKDYILSSGNPVEDAQEIFERLGKWVGNEQVDLTIAGAGATGYASAILQSAFNLDASVVETVAHMRSAVSLYGNVDIICDVGGQDIKVLFMKNDRVVDFKLNTQCSAGNGYFLQGMADQFMIPIEEYAACAFSAERAPKFNYGCAVFMEQDRVNFQQAGWTKEEMMSGLAQVLPLNIWNYVVQEGNLKKLGKTFVLQGGTQKNLAAAKAQVDYIKSKVPGAVVHVHKYADIGGAIGAALEVLEHQKITTSSFIGIDASAKVKFTTKNDDSTTCKFCPNFCKRTFVDITSDGGREIRFISGNLCEKGASEDAVAMKEEQKHLRKVRKKNPNGVLDAAKLAFSDFDIEPIPDEGNKIDRKEYYPKDSLRHLSRSEKKLPFQRSSTEAMKKRADMVVGIPKLLNMFYYNPFFSTYLRTLGVGKVVYSTFTTEKLWSEGNKWGAIDPCFPAKVAPAHIWQLLNRDDVTHICFPIITHLESTVKNTLGNTACTIQMGTPEVVQAVFTRDRDVFKEKNIKYWDPAINLDHDIETAGILYEYFEEILGLTKDENAWAVEQGRKAQIEYLARQRSAFEDVMNVLIDEDRLGLLVIGHPYHHDPGLNHGIPDEFQTRGYPTFTIESIPTSNEFLGPLFSDGEYDDDKHVDIGQLWMRNFNRNTNHKIWAAQVAARHPNLAVIDLSSFKCGHDAPTYTYVTKILDASATPHFTFHDIDQNRPGATFKIRIDTIDYFLKEQEEKLKAQHKE